MKHPIIAMTLAILMLTSPVEIFAKSTKDNIMKQIIVTNQQGDIAVYKNQQAHNENIIFLHGDSGRASQWMDVMNIVSNEYQTIGFDFMGHGNSAPSANADYSLAARAQNIEVVAIAEDLPSFMIVAHSGGAAVALEYAANHADKVRGILLIEPATDPRAFPEEMKQGLIGALSSPAALETIQGYYASQAGSDPAVIAQIQDDAAAVNADARFGVAEALLNWNPEASVNGYDGKIEMHMIKANDNPAALYHLNPNIEHHILTNVGHWVQLDAPEQIAEIVLDFAKKLEN